MISATMKNSFTALLSVILLLVFTQNSVAQNPITPEMMWQMDRVGGLTVSPDGSKAAFTVTSFDIETNASETNIYIMDADSKESRQLTHHGTEGSPAFSPDGNYLAFISRRHGGSGQVYVMPLYGGEARQITDLPVGASAPKWFPDGERIAFSATIHADYNGDWDVMKRIQEEKRNSKVTAFATENRMYRHWDRWLEEGMYPRIFSATLDGEVTDLMPDSRRYFNMMGAPSYDISPDGSEIAISANSTEPPYERLNYDIFLVKTDGSGETRNITSHNPANDSNPVYSPDGQYILYGKQRMWEFYADKTRLAVYDREAENITVLTEDIDLSFSGWIWSENGREIFMQAQDRAKTSLFSIRADGTRLNEVFRGGTNGGVQLFGSRNLIFSHHNFQDPAELHQIRRDGSRLEKLTSFNDERVSQIDYGRVEDITYKGANGNDVQMFVVYPPDFDESNTYPMVMMIHGGPHGIFGDSFHYRWNAHAFAAPGYVVALPNFHGSTSFGQEFTKSIHGNHADLPYRDIMKAADVLAGRSYIDENRMAATGGSYGGYMVSWIAGQTDRFAALVNHAGVYNLMAQFGSDVTGHRAYSYGGSPWENKDHLAATNPAEFAENFSSPMLVIHGELDYRVPIGQGLEVYGVYKARGLDARLVYFPDENHWILSAQNSIYWYEELYNWLERYLKD